MATIANLQILLTAKADSLNRTVKQSVDNLRAFVNRTEAMKEAKINFTAGWTQVRAGVTQARRLVQNFTRTPAGIKLAAFGETAMDKVIVKGMQLRNTLDGVRSRVAGVTGQVGARIGKTLDPLKEQLSSLRIRASAGSRIAGRELGKMFDPVRQRAAVVSGFVRGKLDALKSITPFGRGDVMKSLGPIAGMIKSGVRVPLAFATEGAVRGIGVLKQGVASVKAGVGAIAGPAAAVAAVAATVAVSGMAIAGVMASSIAATTDRIDKIYTLSTAIGASTTNFMGLAKAAEQINDIPMEGFNTALTVMQRNIADAAAAGGGAAEDLAKIGLSAEELSGMGADESFMAIAGGLSEIKNSAMQASIAQGIFGKGGMALLPMLQQGRDGLQAMVDKQKELGVALSDADAANLSAMQGGVDDLSSRVEGATNALTLGMMPATQMVLDLLNQYAPTADTIRGAVMKMARFGVQTIGSLADAWDNLRIVNVMVSQAIVGGLQTVNDAALSLIGMLEKAAAAVGIKIDLSGINQSAGEALKQVQAGLQSQIDEITAKPSKFKQWTADFDRTAKEIEQRGKDLAEAASGKKAATIFADNLGASHDAVQKVVAGMRDQANQIGQGTGAKALNDLAKRRAEIERMRADIMLQMATLQDPSKLQDLAGRIASIDVAVNFVATGVQQVKDAIADINKADITKALDDAATRIEQLKSGLTEDQFGLKEKGATQYQLDRLKDYKKQADDLEEAAKLRDEFRSNADKLKDRIDQINRARAADPKLTEEQVKRAIDKAKQDYAGDGTQEMPVQRAAAVERRTAEGLINTDGSMEGIAKKQLAEAQKQNNSLSVLVGKFTESKVAVVSLSRLIT